MPGGRGGTRHGAIFQGGGVKEAQDMVLYSRGGKRVTRHGTTNKTSNDGKGYLKRHFECHKHYEQLTKPK